MRFWLAAGAINGALAVAFGAFGAHALRGAADPAAFAAFETGAAYHLAHALALVGTAWAVEATGTRLARLAAWAFLAGIILFCGSLYVLGITGSRALVMLTPVGGVSFISGWLFLAAAALGRR